MRIAPLLVAFIFVGVATAGVVPDTGGRNISVANGKGGDHSTFVSGVYSHPSGFSTGASVHSMPSSIHSNSSASRVGAEPTSVHSLYPISRRAGPTGSHSHRSGAPTRASDYPTTSAQSHSRPPSSPSAQPTNGYSHSAAPHTAIASDTHSHQSTPPTAVLQRHSSGLPSGASDHPTPSVSHARSANPSNIHGHRSGSPSDVSAQPEPTASYA